MKIINIKADKMRYQNNSSAYALVLFSLISGMIGMFTLINYDQFISDGSLNMRVVPNLQVGIEILLGITMLLLTFLAAEKIKLYDASWSFYGLFFLAGIHILRIFFLPIYALSQGWITNTTMITVMALYAFSAGLLIIAGVISTRKVIILKHYLRELDN